MQDLAVRQSEHAFKLNIGFGTVLLYVSRTVNLLASMASGYIQWPSEEVRRQQRIARIDEGFGNCTGYIDGSVIALRDKPTNDNHVTSSWKDSSARPGGNTINGPLAILSETKARLLLHCLRILSCLHVIVFIPHVFRRGMLKASIVWENIFHFIDPICWLTSQKLVVFSIQAMRFSSSSVCHGRVLSKASSMVFTRLLGVCQFSVTS